jgi:tRNA nucleotidyltransferase (CCA-adding enzyme)
MTNNEVKPILVHDLSSLESGSDISSLVDGALVPEVLELIKNISVKAEEHNAVLYIVGGFVRDLLLGRLSVDFDLVIDGDAIELAEELVSEYGGQVTVHRRFGTAKWYLSEKVSSDTGLQELDMVSSRSESYNKPSQLPDVKPSSIKWDLQRRDFTVNTLAINLSPENFGELVDFWGGLDDLKAKRLRVLHSRSFIDDPTRILRAVRLEQRLGFNISDKTLDLMVDSISLLDDVSGDRVRHEIERVLREKLPEVVLARLHEIGVSGAIHSSMADHVGRWVDDKFVLAREYTLLSDIVPIYFGLWLYKLSGDEIKSICNRLQVSTKIEQSLRQIVKVRSIVSELDVSTKPSDIVRKLDGLSDIALDVLALAVDKQDIRNNVERFRDEFRFIAPMINGKELLELGLLPGPGLGRILLRLKEEWLDGTISNAEEENTLVQLLVAEEEKRE